ncbi:MAG: TldD/PmbA family protein [Candidatus Methanosuratincola sp.]|nr:TldD/PmbA family protein [Candidatus Methanosuratincola sp.]
MSTMKERLFEIGERVRKGFLSTGADQAIIIPSHVERLMVRFSNNKTTVVQNWSMMGIDALAVFGKKKIITRLEDLSEDGIRKGLERAVKSAPMVSDSETFTDVEGTKFPDRRSAQEIDPERINDCISSCIGAAIKEGGERSAGIFNAEVRKVAILTSSGGEGYDERSAFELNVRAFAGEGSGQGLTCATEMQALDADGAGRRAGITARMSRESVHWSEGSYEVILGPIIFANLIERVGDANSAFSVEAGISFLAGKIGEKVATEKLTIEDDGSDPKGLNSRTFDDEGVPVRKTTIVRGGEMAAYLHNKSTAKRSGTSSTGNAGWVAPSPWNLKVAPGDMSMEEMISEMRRGVFVVSNWYTRFQNYATGDFSTICRDGTFLIEGGEVKGALRGVRISDNMLRMLGSIRQVSSDRSWVRWWEVRTPSLVPAVLASGVMLTKAQGS